MPELVHAMRDESMAVRAMSAASSTVMPSSGVTTLPTERAAAEELAAVLIPTADALRALSFLSRYHLVVVGSDGVGELWTGVRCKHRVAWPLPAGSRLDPGDPVFVGEDDRVLSLAPLALARRPSANADAGRAVPSRGERSERNRARRVPGRLRADERGRARLAERDLRGLRRGRVRSPRARGAVPPELSPMTAADERVFFRSASARSSGSSEAGFEPSPAVLVVVGPSGAGKSSFVRAGVVPALGDANSRAVVFRPERLAAGRSPSQARPAQRPSRRPPVGGRRRPRSHREVHALARARGKTLVLLVDQFEEAISPSPATLGSGRRSFARGSPASPRARRPPCAWSSRSETTSSPRLSGKAPVEGEARADPRALTRTRPAPRRCAGSSSSPRGARPSRSRARRSSEQRWCTRSKGGPARWRSFLSPLPSFGSTATSTRKSYGSALTRRWGSDGRARAARRVGSRTDDAQATHPRARSVPAGSSPRKVRARHDKATTELPDRPRRGDSSARVVVQNDSWPPDSSSSPRGTTARKHVEVITAALLRGVAAQSLSGRPRTPAGAALP